ncbi:MAG: sulfotransferase domain-containing protein [Thermodesulfobacteriota bacterium]
MSKKKLPNFLIVGAAKCGTTSLYHYLKQHPEIYMSPNKEPFFFVCDTIKNQSNKDPRGKFEKSHTIYSFEKYSNLFEQVKNEKAIGEASTAYLYYYQDSIDKIKRYLGDNVKILIILRNPVERAFSAYTHMLGGNWINTSFEKALQDEDYKIKNNWSHIQFCKNLGLYYDQVKAFKDNFKDTKVILLEDLSNNADICLREIYNFLNVDPSYQVNTKNRYMVSRDKVPKSQFVNRFVKIYKILQRKNIFPNSNSNNMISNLFNYIDSKNRVSLSMNPETKEYLINFFAEDVKKLGKLINRDLKGWIEQ